MTLELTASAVLFDMDGTLVDSTAVVEQIWSEFAGENDVDLPDLLAWMHGRPMMDTIRCFLPTASESERIALAQDLKRRELMRLTGIVEIAGARQLLSTLAVPWAVVTSAPRELARRRLEGAGLALPAVLIGEEDVEEGKPSPEGYLLAARLLDVPIHECLVLEDAPAGIAAGVASGAGTVVVGAEHETLLWVTDLSGLRVTAARSHD